MPDIFKENTVFALVEEIHHDQFQIINNRKL